MSRFTGFLYFVPNILARVVVLSLKLYDLTAKLWDTISLLTLVTMKDWPRLSLWAALDINSFKSLQTLPLIQLTEVYSEPCHTSKMEHFAKIVNGFQPLTILVKGSVLDVCQGFEYASSYNITIESIWPRYWRVAKKFN